MKSRVIPVVAAVCVIVSLQLANRPERAPATAGVIRAVTIGDSVAHGAGDETGRGIAGWLDHELRTRAVPFAPTINLGINGARTYNVVRLLRTRTARSAIRIANVVIVSIGGNDLYGDAVARITTLLSPDLAVRNVAERVKIVVRDIERINPSARVILLGLYNPYLRLQFLDRDVNVWDAHLIAMFAADRAVLVERIADIIPERLSAIDHFHPSAAGYALIAARVAVSAAPDRNLR